MTSKKPVAKAAVKTPAKKTPKKQTELTPAPKKAEQEFFMPIEVKDWIEQAGSRLKSQQGKIDRLEAEIKELKSYKQWATNKIMGTSYE
jgi:peptidoglycan hydrolase CwlO-like protein